MQFSIKPPPELDQHDLRRLRAAAAKLTADRLASSKPVARVVGWIEATCLGLWPWELDVSDWSRLDFFDSVSALAWLCSKFDREPTLKVLLDLHTYLLTSIAQMRLRFEEETHTIQRSDN